MSYTSQSIANYNNNPPSDDGTAGDDNQITWAKHKTKLADPIKTLAEAINTANVNAWSDLANTSNDSQGDALIGVDFPDLTNATGTTQHRVNRYAFVNFSVAYNALPDGTTDHTTAIQNAVDDLSSLGGGFLFFPKGSSFYKVTSPIYIKSNVYIIGEGYNSHIRNTRTSWSTYMDHMVMLFGNFDGGQFITQTQYSISGITEGNSTVTFDTSGESANFAAGDIVALKSSEQDSIPSPDFQMINEVVSVGSGTLELRYPVHETLGGTDPTIANIEAGGQTDLLGNSVVAIKDCGVMNMRISNGVERWTGRGACLRGTFRDLHIESGAAFSVNGFAYCLIENCHTRYSVAPNEFAYFCHHTKVVNNDFHYYDNGEGPGGNCFSQGGQNHNNTYIGNTINAGVSAHTHTVSFTNCHDNLFSNNIVYGYSAASALLQVEASSGGASGHNNNVFANNIFHTDNPSYYIKIGAGAATQNNVIGNTFRGTPTTNAVSFNGDGNIVDNNVFEQGGPTFASGAEFNSFSDNSILTNTATYTLTDNDNIVANNRSKSLGYAKKVNEQTQTTVTSTTPNNAVTSVTYPADSLQGEDHIKGRMVCKVPVSSTNDTKDIAIRVTDGVTTLSIASAQLAAGGTGDFVIDFDINISTQGQIFAHSYIDKSGTITGARAESASIDMSADALTLTFEAWVANASDQIVVWERSLNLYRPYEA